MRWMLHAGWPPNLMSIDIQENRSTGVDLREKGRGELGQTVYHDGRLYMQLLVFTDFRESPQILTAALAESEFCGALYSSLHDPAGIGLLTVSEDPRFFATELQSYLKESPFSRLQCRTDWTMIGRTYAIGYETDLIETLFDRPRRYICNPLWPWAIWYPLRRSGEFEHLSTEERRTILMEHGGIGLAYGRSDHAHDIRLACHGLDQNDNDFVVGLLSKDLHPLSAIIERMRKTQQTSRYLSGLGPFFVGYTLWQSPLT